MTLKYMFRDELHEHQHTKLNKLKNNKYSFNTISNETVEDTCIKKFVDENNLGINTNIKYCYLINHYREPDCVEHCINDNCITGYACESGGKIYKTGYIFLCMFLFFPLFVVVIIVIVAIFACCSNALSSKDEYS
jgi:hypothetical protein